MPRGKDIRDIGARTRTAHHESFRKKLLIGQHDDGARNVQLLRQLARRRQTLCAHHDAPQDRLAKPQIDLPRKRLLIV